MCFPGAFGGLAASRGHRKAGGARAAGGRPGMPVGEPGVCSGPPSRQLCLSARRTAAQTRGWLPSPSTLRSTGISVHVPRQPVHRPPARAGARGDARPLAGHQHVRVPDAALAQCGGDDDGVRQPEGGTRGGRLAALRLFRHRSLRRDRAQQRRQPGRLLRRVDGRIDRTGHRTPEDRRTGFGHAGGTCVVRQGDRRAQGIPRVARRDQAPEVPRRRRRRQP